LDFATGEKIMELMFDLNREQGTTLVLVTHDRAIAQRCDRRITIEAGRVV
jgi:putative ABC transport system ATP-binding protein